MTEVALESFRYGGGLAHYRLVMNDSTRMVPHFRTEQYVSKERMTWLRRLLHLHPAKEYSERPVSPELSSSPLVKGWEYCDGAVAVKATSTAALDEVDQLISRWFCLPPGTRIVVDSNTIWSINPDRTPERKESFVT